MALVSIIIPAYNASRYIGECLTSIVSQDFDDWEVCIVDDGSTDSTCEICRRFTGDNRVKLLSQPNRGVSAARNEGLRMATGEYVMFVDADDLLPRGSLATFFSAYQQAPQADIIRGEYCAIDESGRPLFTSNNKVFRKSRIRVDGDVNHFIQRYIKTDYFLWLMWIRRSTIGAIRFNERIGFMEDAEFLLRVLGTVGQCVYLPRVTYFYRKLMGSASAEMTPKKITDILVVISNLLSLLVSRAQGTREELLPSTYVYAINQCWTLIIVHITTGDYYDSSSISYLKSYAINTYEILQLSSSSALQDFINLDFTSFRKRYLKRYKHDIRLQYVYKISKYLKSRF